MDSLIELLISLFLGLWPFGDRTPTSVMGDSPIGEKAERFWQWTGFILVAILLVIAFRYW